MSGAPRAGSALEDFGLHALPAELDGSWRELAQQLQLRPLPAGDVADDFGAAEPLPWAADGACRVLFLGENHHYQAAHHLRNRALFAPELAEPWALVLLEEPHSLSGFFEHYLSLPQESAEAFLQGTLRYLAPSEEVLQLLRHVRRWNARFPTRALAVGSYDLEYFPRSALEGVVWPYFRSKGLGQLTRDARTFAQIDDVLPALLRAAEADGVPDDPAAPAYLRASFVRAVLRNLRDSVEAELYEQDGNRMFVRQQAIVRNLTAEYAGRSVARDRVLVHGGSFHSASRWRYPPGSGFLREASYLQHEYPATRGRVCSVSVRTIAFRFDERALIDPEQLVLGRTAYGGLIGRLQSAYAEGRVVPGGVYAAHASPTPADRLILAASAARAAAGPVQVSAFPWEAVLARACAEFPERCAELKQQRRLDESHDYVVYVPASSLIQGTRRKHAGAGGPAESAAR